MGLIRKTVAVSTLGAAARYRHKEEREEHDRKVMKKELKNQTKLLREFKQQREANSTAHVDEARVPRTAGGPAPFRGPGRRLAKSVIPEAHNEP